MSDAISNLIVKGTLVLLLAFSIVTWAIVVAKAVQSVRLRRQDERARRVVSSGRALPTLEALGSHTGPVSRVASAAVSTWQDVSASAEAQLSGALSASEHPVIEVQRDILERTLRQQLQHERRLLEGGLAVLASIGTTAPFVGLFGTVWGIMHALEGISRSGSASLDVVAGPIGEALVATGIGIAVAVPAVLAYNFFVRRLKVQGQDLEDLASSLVSLALFSTLSGAPRSSAQTESSISQLTSRGRSSLREARV